MASITACTSTSVACTGLVHKTSIYKPSPAIVGLAAMKRGGRVLRCRMKEEKSSVGEESEAKMVKGGGSIMGAGMSMVMSPEAAMGLVDERLSTEGTGLAFGLSNNLLGWILVAVFGLIWTLYFTYTSSLQEDEESGLSL